MATKNNEQILAALVATGSVRAAAKAVGVSETTIRARLNDPDFRKEYETAKGAILTEACDSLAARHRVLFEKRTDRAFSLPQKVR